MEDFDLKNTFFFINRTSFFFPKMSYNIESVPLGDSIPICIAVSWAPKERGNNYDLMKPVSGFPRCSQTETGKFIWNVDDPINGIDIPVWRQKSFKVECADEEECIKTCKYYGAVFNNVSNNVKRCYNYEVLDNICIIVEYDASTDDYKFAGGCFKDGLHYQMIPGEEDKIYHFDDVEIEVRNKKDPIIKAGHMSNYNYSFGEDWVTNIFNL